MHWQANPARHAVIHSTTDSATATRRRSNGRSNSHLAGRSAPGALPTMTVSTSVGRPASFLGSSMTHPNALGLLDDLIGRCKQVLAGVDTVIRRAILADLAAIRDHLTAAEQRDFGEWIRDHRRKASVTFLRIWKSPHAKPTPITLAVHLSPCRLADDR